MPDFIVTKKEQWTQRVMVTGAKGREDAINKAVDGDGVIFEDAKYDCNVASGSWEVEEVE